MRERGKMTVQFLLLFAFIIVVLSLAGLALEKLS
jgi:hypothetical protein